MATKRDFEEAARIIRAMREETTIDQSAFSLARMDTLFGVANRFADYFGRENSRFNRGLFLKACGIGDPRRED